MPHDSPASEHTAIQAIELDLVGGSTLLRRRAIAFVRQRFVGAVDCSSQDHRLGQAVDATLALTLVGVVAALAQLAVALETRHKRQEWTVDRAKEAVRVAAAEFVGTDNITNLRFEGLTDFLSERRRAMRVTAEIDDEEYSFVVRRDGDTLFVGPVTGH